MLCSEELCDLWALAIPSTPELHWKLENKNMLELPSFLNYINHTIIFCGSSQERLARVGRGSQDSGIGMAPGLGP